MMLRRPRWHARAACRGATPTLFYDPHPVAIAAAKAVCAGCAVRQQCAAHALAAGEEFGVWGGRASDERPASRHPGAAVSGPSRQIGDDELYDLFIDADPERPAIDQLLEHIYLPTATAYRALERAVRLGVVEHRGRCLYPTRR